MSQHDCRVHYQPPRHRCHRIGMQRICPGCCLDMQGPECAGCDQYDESVRLNFACAACRARALPTEPDPVVRQLAHPVFLTTGLDGPRDAAGRPVAGEGYRVTLTFPFDQHLQRPFWLAVGDLVRPERLAMVEAGIVAVAERHPERARVEVLALSVCSLAEFASRLPPVALDLASDPADQVLRFGSDGIRTRVSGGLRIVESICQDGGEWGLFQESADGAALVLYREGWFCDWGTWAGHVRVPAGHYARLLAAARPLPYVCPDCGREHAVPPKHCGCQVAVSAPPAAACYLVACQPSHHDAVVRWLREERQAPVADLGGEAGVDAVYPLLELAEVDLQVDPPGVGPALAEATDDSQQARVRALLDTPDDGAVGATGRFLVCESVESGIEVVDAFHREIVALQPAVFDRLRTGGTA